MSKFSDKNKDGVPKDFFVKFGQKMLDKTLEEEIFDASDYPILSSNKKKSDFTTPEKYFENLEVVSKSKKPKSFSIYNAMAIAASLLLIVSLFTLSNKNAVESKQELASIEEIDFYLNNSDEIEIIDIVELQELFDAESNNDLPLDKIENDILIDYLFEESDTDDLVSIY